MKILFLDDNVDRAEAIEKVVQGHQFKWAQTTSVCIADLTCPTEWDIVCLDHDLGDEVFVNSDREDCGMVVVRFLQENQLPHLKHTIFIVHSFNVPAAVTMTSRLQEANYKTYYIPITSLADTLKGLLWSKENS